ncbi:hypothetical protein EYF80_003110 [Liparis tanakae]|uniref:Uncharacterized protein n=1 Tax=Liparis tanakae TaxID=230148 RepID=A0A4Z2JBF8_9TELE|nr:hypothetical protein EYF80_003110 [Liparis tanakae]
MVLPDRFTGWSGCSIEQIQMSKILFQAALAAPLPTVPSDWASVGALLRPYHQYFDGEHNEGHKAHLYCFPSRPDGAPWVLRLPRAGVRAGHGREASHLDPLPRKEDLGLNIKAELYLAAVSRRSDQPVGILLYECLRRPWPRPSGRSHLALTGSCVIAWDLCQHTYPTVKNCLISCRRERIICLYSPMRSFFPSMMQVLLGRGLYL